MPNQLSEEAAQVLAEYDDDALVAYTKVPYALMSDELGDRANDFFVEINKICKYYRIYENGANFFTEGTNGDYTPATLHYRISKGLIDKEARFLFAEAPNIQVQPKGDVGRPTTESVDAITALNDLVETVFKKNRFNQLLVKAAKDCFIGRRVAGIVNFNEDDGITVQFLPSTQFIYETKLGNPNVLTKFVAFVVTNDSLQNKNKRIFKKKFELVDGVVYIEEALYDGAGVLIERVTPRQKTLMPVIPVVVIINDGLTGDLRGESEIEILKDYEQWYSKLSNADIDAERKSMNPIKYTVDMDGKSTEGLSTAAGAYWDLGTDQQLDKISASVGMLEPTMSYSAALKTSLDRIKSVGYEQVDMPDVALQTMTGAITSGKALKAVYWPLIVRCKEKMMTWGPQLEAMVDFIIRGAMVFPKIALMYSHTVLVPVDYEVHVEQNTPLPEDEVEDKTMDLNEVASQTMSRAAYMKKWRKLTDDEVNEELEQIARENEIINNSFGFEQASSGTVEGDDTAEDGYEEPSEGEEQPEEQQDHSGELSEIMSSLESLAQQIGA